MQSVKSTSISTGQRSKICRSVNASKKAIVYGVWPAVIWAAGLGTRTRYPQIYDFHNKEAARYGVRPIDNENLIFVGQTILIPPRQKFPEPGNGTKAAGDQLPIPLKLKVTYSIGRDTPPIIYVASYGDYSIKAEMKGIMNQYPRVRAKFKVWLEFYQKIDPIFTEEYLLGEGGNVTKHEKPGTVYEQ